MILIFFFVLAFALALFPTLRCAVFHPFAMALYSVKDFYHYLRRKEFNLCGTGELVAYTGLFGKGKTLSAVHRVVTAYHRYDGKQVWCPRRKEFVAQRVKVISNVALSIPYEDFISLEQIVLACSSAVSSSRHSCVSSSFVSFHQSDNSSSLRCSVMMMLLSPGCAWSQNIKLAVAKLASQLCLIPLPMEF